MWIGVVVYAEQSSAMWMRIVQALFGILLFGWAVQKIIRMLTKA